MQHKKISTYFLNLFRTLFKYPIYNITHFFFDNNIFTEIFCFILIIAEEKELFRDNSTNKSFLVSTQ